MKLKRELSICIILHVHVGSTTHAAMVSAPRRVLDISTEALLLTHPGKVLDLTKINKAKKFRNHGDIHGGLAAMQNLEKAGLGKLAPNKSRGSVKVNRATHCARYTVL